MNIVQSEKTVLVTGANGLLGRHARVVVEASNGAARYGKVPIPWNLLCLGHSDFDNDQELLKACEEADLVLHFAGINRAPDELVENGNIRIGKRLCWALEQTHSAAHVIYANSTHSEHSTAYGRGKAGAAVALQDWSERAQTRFTDVLLPHVFGESGRPFYNTVTSTLCRQILDDEIPTINEGAEVELLHAGSVIDSMLAIFANSQTGKIRLAGKKISVNDLYLQLKGFYVDRSKDQFPAINDKFDVALFQTLQTAGFPESVVTPLKSHVDDRGYLFEAAKGGAGGQTFLSWTKPDIERGNHFHRYKVERFVVVEGHATIKMRHVLESKAHIFEVSGENPVAVDMPAHYAHSIVNTGDKPLLTMFWAHEIFNPEVPDTWFCDVSLDGAEVVNHNINGMSDSNSR